MYGISNSQQQGGGGGSAASYKAIKSILTPSDWQEVAKQPYFVGSNAMEWPIDDEFEVPAKRSNDIIGLTSGVDYTISVTVDGQVYTKTAQIRDPSQTSGMKILTFGLTDDNTLGVMIYDDVSAMMPGVSSFVGIEAPTTVTSFVITSFTGVDFGSSGRATISDSAIKVNSAVTMYTNTSEKIAVGEKTNGSITLTAPSVPNAIISYSLEIVGTDTEGLFELINGYIPEITPSAVPQWHTIFESATPVVSAEIGTNMIQPGQLYRVTVDMSGEANPDNYDMFIASSPGDYFIPFSQVDVSGSSPSSIGVIVFRIEYTTTTSGVIELSPIARYEVTSAGITNFFAVNNVDTWKFTKLEVYR